MWQSLDGALFLPDVRMRQRSSADKKRRIQETTSTLDDLLDEVPRRPWERPSPCVRVEMYGLWGLGGEVLDMALSEGLRSCSVREGDGSCQGDRDKGVREVPLPSRVEGGRGGGEGHSHVQLRGGLVRVVRPEGATVRDAPDIDESVSVGRWVCVCECMELCMYLWNLSRVIMFYIIYNI